MKISTALNHRDRFKSKVNDVYYWCRMSGYTHEYLLHELTWKVYNDPAWKKVPAWVRQSVTDLTQILSKQLYKPDLYAADLEKMIEAARNGRPFKPAAYLRWQLRVDGEHMDTDEIIRRRKAGDEDIWHRVEGAHIWNHKPENAFSPWGMAGSADPPKDRSE